MYQSVSVSYNFATAAIAAAFMAGVARNPELAGAAPAGGSVSTIPSAPPPVAIPDRYFFNMMTSNLSVVTAGQLPQI